MREERKTEWKDILDGVGLFVRDTDLPKHCAEKYQVGTVLMERGFTDASVHVGGMATTHRFAVLSNHMRDFRSFE